MSRNYNFSKEQVKVDFSLEWYMKISLEDMVADFIVGGNRGGIIHRSKQQNNSTNWNNWEQSQSDKIDCMLELPLGSDVKLAVKTILDSIKLNSVSFTKGCSSLMVGFLSAGRRQLKVKHSEVINTLKEEFLHMMERLPPPKPPRSGDKDSSRVAKVKKNEAFGRIFATIYLKGCLKTTEVLYYLHTLSERNPTQFDVNLLLTILEMVGSSMERKVGLGSSSYYKRWGESSTLDKVYQKLEECLPLSSKHQSVLKMKKIIEERNQRRMLVFSETEEPVPGYQRSLYDKKDDEASTFL